MVKRIRETRRFGAGNERVGRGVMDDEGGEATKENDVPGELVLDEIDGYA